VAVPSTSKAVLPRHTAILGTTGGGKSTTVAGLVARAQAAGMAVVLLDVEGEYTFLHEPTDDGGCWRRARPWFETGRAPAGEDVAVPPGRPRHGQPVHRTCDRSRCNSHDCRLTR
jgi:hypothetical protein